MTLDGHYEVANVWSRHQSFWARHDRMPIEINIPSFETRSTAFVVYEIQRFDGWVRELVTRKEVRTSSRRPKLVPY